MKFIEKAHSCLMDVLYKKVPFKLAIENTCSRHTVFKEERKSLTSIVGCSLRHFYIFDNILSRLELEFSDEQKALLCLYLSNRLFVSVLSAKEVDEQFEKQNISMKNIEKVDELSSDKLKLISEEYPSDSIEYLHFRYNIPTWCLKMWMKHYKGYTYKIVKTINRPLNHYAVLTNKNEDISKHPELIASKYFGLYQYNGKVSPSRHSLFKENKAVEITPAEFYVLTKLDLDSIRKSALYCEIDNSLPSELYGMIGKNYQMDIIAGTPAAYYASKKTIERYGLNGVNLFEANHKSIITCLSNKVHTFFVIPNNTNFAEFRNSPDYFNRVDQSLIDSYIAGQKDALESASEFVEDGGDLVYIIPTMNKKETVQIVEDFLKAHKDYVLVEQKQFLPFDKYDSTLFFAVLRKEETND